MKPFHEFFQLQSSGGILLSLATILALFWANSQWADSYEWLWHLSLGFAWGAWSFVHPLHFWVNDALMAIFFLLVGLEIKRELLVGELSTLKKAALPFMAALGGMIFPAILYMLLTGLKDPAFMPGWGIPTVTDIAFALGVLAMLGQRVPIGLKVFLTALAIIDDLGAIVLIALFYSNGLDGVSLLCTGGIFAALIALNRMKIRHPFPYALLGILLWLAVLYSGLHATIAGVLLACAIPADAPEPTLSGQEFSDETETLQSPLQKLEHVLNPWVSYGILPLFALANAGVKLPVDGLGNMLLQPIGLGIILGLFLGKQTGITLFSWLFVRLGWAELPQGVSWTVLYGAAILGGIGFTMSLFISVLAFQSPEFVTQAKVGVMAASLLSGVIGLLVLLRLLPQQSAEIE